MFAKKQRLNGRCITCMYRTSNHTGLWSDTAPLLTRSSMPHIPVSRSSKLLAATIRRKHNVSCPPWCRHRRGSTTCSCPARWRAR